MVFTYEQKKYLALITKCTAILSIMGSVWIVQEVLRDKIKRSRVYHRLLLAMSISDIFSSTNVFIGNWAIPAGTEGVYDPKGNELTCTIQGFFIQLSIITPLYNACLSIYYLLLINYNWREQHLRKVEPFLHCFALLWGFGTAIALLCLDQFHNATLWCWIASTNQTTLFRWVLFLGPIWLVIFLVTVIMCLIYRHVNKHERTRDKYDFAARQQQRQQQQQNAPDSSPAPRISITRASAGGDNNNNNNNRDRNRRYSRRFAKQAAFYVLAFYLSFIFATSTRLIQAINGKVYYPIMLLFAIFAPMQGFMNFLVYKATAISKYASESSSRVMERMATSFQAIPPIRRPSNLDSSPVRTPSILESRDTVAGAGTAAEQFHHSEKNVRETFVSGEMDSNSISIQAAEDKSSIVVVPANNSTTQQHDDAAAASTSEFDTYDTSIYSA